MVGRGQDESERRLIGELAARTRDGVQGTGFDRLSTTQAAKGDVGELLLRGGDESADRERADAAGQLAGAENRGLTRLRRVFAVVKGRKPTRLTPDAP